MTQRQPLLPADTKPNFQSMTGAMARTAMTRNNDDDHGGGGDGGDNDDGDKDAAP
jgi:hypothetical protein